MIIKYSPSFLKTFKNIDVRIRKSFKEKILIFTKDPLDLQLDNHELKKEWQGYRSIDITADWRALYREDRLREDTIAYFVALGRHIDLYQKSGK